MNYSERIDCKEFVENLTESNELLKSVLDVMLTQMETFAKDKTKESAEKGMKLNDEFFKIVSARAKIAFEIERWSKYLDKKGE